MDETQKYLFDLQGYLVIENALSPEEVATLNELLDQQKLPAPGEKSRFGAAPAGPGFLQWGKPFCDLLDHPQIMPILRFRLGDCFRLDRIYGLCSHEGEPRGPIHSDYGASKPTSHAQPGEHYHSDIEILNGFVVVGWNLSATGPDHGGFCCIPGSHKSNFKLPREILDVPEKASCVVTPSVPAGSVVLFTEALTHGTAAWTAKHERRSVLYKYCVSQMAWLAKRMQQPTNVDLTPRQKILFLEPADPYRHFPSLFEGD